MTNLRQVAQQALEALEDERYVTKYTHIVEAITALHKALEQPEQHPVAYDKTEINCFVQSLYDQKMQEGKHGHYETMFHVVHQAIKKVAPPAAQRPWQGLDEDEIRELYGKDLNYRDGNYVRYAKSVEAKLKERNGY